MRDLRLAFRTLRSTPIASAVAVLSLALGIGVNLATFSLLDGLLLRNLPVTDPGGLVMLSSGTAVDPSPANLWTLSTWEQFRQRAGIFDGAFAWSRGRLDLSRAGEAQPADGLFVSGSFFTTLDVRALVGRVLTPADDVAGGGPDGPVAVIGYRFWQPRFGGAAAAVGTRLVIEGVSFKIVGVMPAGFFGVDVGSTFDVAVSLSAVSPIHARDALAAPSTRWLRVMLRLQPDQSIEAATAALRAMQPQIRDAAMPEDFPQLRRDFLKEPFTLVPAAGGVSGLRGRYVEPLIIVLVVAVLILFIAGANVTNLLLARATDRRHELSVRLAVGARRWQLARPFMVESLVLVGLGTVIGLLVAAWSSRVLVAQLGTAVALNLSPDWRVMVFLSVVVVATVVLAGLAPAVRATRAAPIGALKAQGRFGGGGRKTVSSGLVVAQVAVGVVLVAAAGLFIGTFARLADVPLGFDPDRVLLVNVDATRTAAPPARRGAIYQQLVGSVAALPGVGRAAASLMTPVTGGGFLDMFVEVAGAPPMPERQRHVLVNFVTPGWFATYGIPVRAGRDFNAGDTSNAPPVVLVNDAFVRRFVPDRNAIGKTVAVELGAHGEVPVDTRTVIGIVADAVYRTLREPPPPTMYLSLSQWPHVGIPLPPRVSLGVRSSIGPPSGLSHSVAAALAAVDSGPTFTFGSLADQVATSLAQERLVAAVSGIFGVLALVLAGLGVFGVTAYAVSRQRVEIGIRLALGATPARVMAVVLGRVLVLVGAGAVLGTATSLWLSPLVASLLFGVQARDPIAMAGAAVSLAAAGALAGWLPALGASRIQPADLLREN